MTEDELRKNLRYLIDKYIIDKNKKDEIYNYIDREDVPVKGILADLNNFRVEKITQDDGNLIRDIYFHYC
ncbi:hypothetical protein KD5_03520 [Yersinia pseudotuberculosis]|uniref:Uncharacterized protein n=1 Tax=Yersinia pseudotuberculosis TaxID=633 RepID=A0A380Q4E2_YERPU|nr:MULTISPECIES: hypothetical protein [Yersinia pseudotuberculosis complex]AYW91609.1 hypothetical protein EGX47_09955 [Yersinia pseudotuberculosis]AYW95930.1 hypothetical protein EGX39_08880 [Yersinia pseudotuberculosis]MBO1548974.1 hypothetical protein [Yersinia pseudotuberculosis]MBO1569127.1 hypothetical protein [Yersinia pseudotuberculosis]MBO1584097.1 hypothetical protein [Yersinia pseudotuberculosis]